MLFHGENNTIVLCVIEKGKVPFSIIANIFECEVKKETFLTAPYSYVNSILEYDTNNEYLKYVNAMSFKSDSFLNFIKNEFIPKYTNSSFNFDIPITDKLFSSTLLDENKYNQMSHCELNNKLTELNERNSTLAMNKQIYTNMMMKEEFVSNMQTIIFIENRIKHLDTINVT